MGRTAQQTKGAAASLKRRLTTDLQRRLPDSIIPEDCAEMVEQSKRDMAGTYRLSGRPDVETRAYSARSTVVENSTK